MKRQHWPGLCLQKVTVPTGKRGLWIIKRFRVTPKNAEWFNLKESINPGMGCRQIAPGTYTGLFKVSEATQHLENHGEPWMSDTPAEMWDHHYFVENATGRILISGLGIGLCVHNLLLKKTVVHITVVEIDKDLIQLVGPHYQRDPRVRVVHHDALTWQVPKGEHFDAAWHDIWPSITSDNLPQVAALKRRYQHHVAKGQQSAWCEDQMRYKRSQERRW